MTEPTNASAPAAPNYAARLAALRQELGARGLDGFVVPISDEHMSEYVGAYAQRLEWLTGFGGSAGTAVVLADAALDPAAAIFVDGRYTLAVRDAVDGALYAYENVPATSPAQWLGEHAPQGARIGYDAWLHTRGWARAAQKALAKRGAELVAMERNPIDAVWADRPAPSSAPAEPHPLKFTGVASGDKRAAVAEWLLHEGLDAAVIPALDSVAWLLNLRGADVARTPVALAFAIAYADGSADLFIAPEKVTPALRDHLGNAVRIAPYADFAAALASLSGRRVAVDAERSVAAIFAALETAGAHVVEARDPTVLPRATKNPVEQAGHRAAQARDGAAMARFLHWLSVEAPKGGLTEMAAADRLEAFRAETAGDGAGALVDLSFDTISGSGPNGAIVHYRVSGETNRVLAPGSVYLVDSGGQYADGTTDITRTLWIGGAEPPAEVKDRFTRVLKGHIALARAIFPARHAGAPAPVGGRARLCPWHRPRCRQLSERARGAAAHRQAQRRTGGHGAGAGAGHDPLQRAGILQGGGLWHPHREPADGGGARDRRGRRGLSGF